MKITIDISDELFTRSQALATRRGITFDELVMEALECVLPEDDPDDGQDTLEETKLL